jgi:hypothetical protein
MIRENDLKDLGFNKNVITQQESGNNSDYYYYSLQLTVGITLTSKENDLVVDDTWYVDDYDNGIRFESIDDLRTFITLVTKSRSNFK